MLDRLADRIRIGNQQALDVHETCKSTLNILAARREQYFEREKICLSFNGGVYTEGVHTISVHAADFFAWDTVKRPRE